MSLTPYAIKQRSKRAAEKARAKERRNERLGTNSCGKLVSVFDARDVPASTRPTGQNDSKLRLRPSLQYSRLCLWKMNASG